jgi:hypothetical protein
MRRKEFANKGPAALPYNIPTNAAEWRHLREVDPARAQSIEKVLTEEARKIAAAGISFRGAARMAEKTDCRPVAEEARRWVEAELTRNLVDQWRQWRAAEHESVAASVAWMRIEKIIGYHIAGTMHPPSGEVRLMGSEVPEHVHAVIRGVEADIVSEAGTSASVRQLPAPDAPTVRTKVVDPHELHHVVIGPAPELAEDDERGITNLRERVEAIERAGALAYDGVYEPGKAYRRGAAVTHQGSLWIAMLDTTSRPGASDDWRLAVKRGRDGKDAR